MARCSTDCENGLGPDVPIVATVDLHANVSDRMAANCNGLLSFRTYPHVDQREVGFEACRMLQSAMQLRTRRSVQSGVCLPLQAATSAAARVR